MCNEREIELEEYIESKGFPKHSAIRRRLDALLWKEAHPIQECVRQIKFKIKYWGWW